MEVESYEKGYKYKNRYTRGLFFWIGDALSLLFSAIGAYFLLSPFSPAIRPFPVGHTFIVVISVLIALAAFRMYAVSWRHTGLRDLIRSILGITVGGLSSLGIAHFYLTVGNYEYAFTALLLINALLLISGFRISKRIVLEITNSALKKHKHTIIFGGGSEGEQILRDILKNDHWDLSVYGIFDDRVMPGLRLHGVSILGGKDKMLDYIQSHPVDQLIIAFPEIPKKDLKNIISDIKAISSEMDIKILPSFHSLTDDPAGLNLVRDVSIEDLLGREPVNIDMKLIDDSIKGKIVLVTGAGGSIGSELVRQCVKMNPQKLIALDIDETELFHIQGEFKESPIDVIPCVASIVDVAKINRILKIYKPDVIFHVAAYKHVPMMEDFPEEAIKVNIGGTRSLASLACNHEVNKFIMVSTDKAVNPVNVMGATKRVAEEICMAYNEMGVTKFISVRFGNVLGSRGSVVPFFIEQIKKGGPLTVTDPEMERYFMTIPEAVLLVMQAGSMGRGGEVFVLDMGEPVNILDMARDLIKLHSLVPDKDIKIEIVGIRPGEKLFEELLNAGEGVTETEHKEIYKADCTSRVNPDELEAKIFELFDSIENETAESIRESLQSLVPTYMFKERKIAQIKKENTNGSVKVG